jgi:hypothetical protein
MRLRLLATWTEPGWITHPVQASTVALCERFYDWIADEVARQPGEYSPAATPRFIFFIKVDG